MGAERAEVVEATQVSADEFDIPPVRRGVSHSGSSISGVVNLTNTILGAGMLGMPSGFKECGLTLGLIILCMSAIGAGFALFLLYHVANFIEEKDEEARTLHESGASKHGEESGITQGGGYRPITPSFFAAAKLTFPKLAIVIDLAIVIKCMGVATSYLIVFGDLLPDIISAHFDVSGSWKFLLNRRFWISVAMCFPIVELVLLKRIDSLRFTSILALGAVVYLLFIVIYFSFDPPDIDGESPHFPNPSVTYGSIFSLSLFEVMPIFLFGFTCHQNLLPIYNELREPTLPRMARVIVSSVATCLTVYVTVGVLGYLTYGTEATSNIINDYPTDVGVTIGRIAIAMLVTFSYPLQSFPLRASLDTMVGEMMVLQGVYIGGLEYFESERTYRDTKPTLRYLCESFFICGVTYTIAMILDDLGVVFGLVGATGSTTICYILPGLFYFGSQSGKGWSVMRILSVCSFVFGVCFMFTSVTFILLAEFQ